MSDTYRTSQDYGNSAKAEGNEETGATADRVRKEAAAVADAVSGKASEYADDARDATAEQVGSVASALRTAADELRKGSPQERTFSQLADSLADASEAMRDKDLGQMLDGVSSFARRNPALFLGGAALLGFAATRFSKASERRGEATSPTNHTPPPPASAHRPGPIPEEAPLSRGATTKPVSGGMS